MTSLNLKPAKIHGVRYLGDHAFPSLKAAVEATPTTTEGLAIFVPNGQHYQSARATLPKDRTTMIVGTGAPSRGISYLHSNGSIIYGGDANGMLVVETTPSQTTEVTLRDVEFRQYTNMTARTNKCIDLALAKKSLVENVNVLNITSLSGVAYPMTGTALSVYMGAAAGPYTEAVLRNVKLGGMGGTEADPAFHLLLGSDKCFIDNLEIDGAQKLVCGIDIYQVGYDMSMKNLAFKRMGTSGNTTMSIWLLAGENPTPTLGTFTLDGLSVQLYYPRNTQYAPFRWYNSDIRMTLSRVFLDGFSQFAMRADYSGGRFPNGLVLRGRVTGYGAFGDTPTGFVTDCFDTSSSLISPFPAGSTAAVPTASTTYTVEIRSVVLYAYGGTSVAVTVNGVSVPYDTTNGSTYVLDPGDTINFGAFTGTVTVRAKFLE
jgi:hypothetical protein